MSRLFTKARANGGALAVLFDTRARVSYITRSAARRAGLPLQGIPETRVSIGGRRFTVLHRTVFDIEVEGCHLDGLALVVDDLGAPEELGGAPLDLIVGATEMERYSVRIDFAGRAPVIDLSAGKKREFVEY